MIFVIHIIDLYLFSAVKIPGYCIGVNALATLGPLDDVWRCEAGRELYGVWCGSDCGVIFGNDEGMYSKKDKTDDIFVCSNASKGKCCFAVCSKHWNHLGFFEGNHGNLENLRNHMGNRRETHGK